MWYIRQALKKIVSKQARKIGHQIKIKHRIVPKNQQDFRWF
jgi:hypothetical protein